MPRPAYTPLPPPPSIGDPSFATKADSFLGALPGHHTYMENMANWLQTDFYAELNASDTATLPALRWSGDSDTGLWHPAANQVALTEGGVDRGRLYGRKNILGTVAQSAGVPTEAILEAGSNANGEYLRIADGTQFCWHVLNSSASADVTWAFPAAFVNTAKISPQISVLTGALGVQEPHVVTIAVGNLTFHVSSGSARIAVGTRLFAAGRWY